jgi:hypothetical protein
MTAKRTTVWVPKAWIEWIERYYKENEEDLKLLGIMKSSDLVWRLAEFGKPRLDEALGKLKDQDKRPPSQRHGNRE